MDVILIVCLGLAALAALGAIFASSKNWRWHTIVLVVLILAFNMGFMILAARALKLHQGWMLAARDVELRIKKIEGAEDLAPDQRDPNNNLLVADEIRKLREEIRRTIAGRGRVWRMAKRSASPPAPAGRTPDPAALTVTIESPDPHAIGDKTNVYVFESDDQGNINGPYLGEFRVNALRGKQVDLVPIFPVSTRELNRIKSAAPTARESLTLYESMPTDSHEAFAGAGDQVIRDAMPNVPGSVLEEYLKDGQPVGINDPPENIEVRVRFLKEQPIAAAPGARPDDPKTFKEGQLVWLPLLGSAAAPGAEALIRQGVAEEDRSSPRRYVRQLRDYKRQFDQAHEDRSLTLAGIEQARRDDEALRNAQTALDAQFKVVENNRTAVAADLDKFKAELAEVGKLLGEVQNQWEAVRAELYRVYSANRQLAGQLAALQARSVEELQKRAGAASVAGDLDRPRIP